LRGREWGIPGPFITRERGSSKVSSASPRFETSDEWEVAERTVQPAEGKDTVSIVLRNHGAGTVSHDDVSVTIE